MEVLHHESYRISWMYHNLVQFSEMLTEENAGKQAAGYSACEKILWMICQCSKTLVKVLCLNSYSFWTSLTIQISYVKRGISFFPVTTVSNLFTVYQVCFSAKVSWSGYSNLTASEGSSQWISMCWEGREMKENNFGENKRKALEKDLVKECIFF